MRPSLSLSGNFIRIIIKTLINFFQKLAAHRSESRVYTEIYAEKEPGSRSGNAEEAMAPGNYCGWRGSAQIAAVEICGVTYTCAG